MTLGELAKMFNGERHLGAHLAEIATMEGWQRETGLIRLALLG